ncbi:mechanosensitive ion channel protein MscS [Prosthecochloris sp. GSB1]|uniref:mechanosensitive ion channel family protein n=1 Tax=Prosthecochloris sp. GSB1 TaxID=281093 RepID=UPI000B8D189A|nr:mechanosensitive ion channel domain-containing protein [Prosthecochloris sp. GSB1]ASQ90792.1 mechanosensitive ion channel protein MscS [Prosthecochloris sp. GSB1]
MIESLLAFLESHGLNDVESKLLLTAAMVLLSAGIIVLLERIVKQVLLRVIVSFARKTTTHFDDIMVKHNVFNLLAHLVPPLLIFNLAVPALQFYPDSVEIVQSLSTIYLTVVFILVTLAMLDVSIEYYNEHPVSGKLPLKSFIQVIKTIVVSIGAVIVISKLIGKSPVVFFSGLGAFTAVILLIFKDSILGLVAGIQLTTNNLVRVGDWIEMPKYGADGDVVDISLVTVSVRNWDKTISTIPAYALISEGFKNWRGMSESGGRRIKRSVNIDMNSVRFCDDEMLAQLQRIQLLRDYLSSRTSEIDAFNAEHRVDASCPVNGRRLTNLGSFRAYLVAYLRNHPKISPDMTFLVRHLQPEDKGIPVEFYVFSTDTAWANYEAIQADIMDHVLSVLPFFGLSVFQAPSGLDVVSAGRAMQDMVAVKAGDKAGE